MASYRPFAPPPPPPAQNPNPNTLPPHHRHHQHYPPNPNPNFNIPPFQQPYPHQSHQFSFSSHPPPQNPNPNPPMYHPPLPSSAPPPPPPLQLPAVAPPPPSSPPPPPQPLLPPKTEVAKRMETEEERRVRKRREYEKQRAEERRQHMLKQSQASVLQRTKQVMGSRGGSSHHHHGSMLGSKMVERRTNPILGGDRIENNRLKKPTTFLCKFKFRNELPDPTAQPKLLPINTDKDRYTRYAITSLEKNYKPKLTVEPDLGIPLDLLDLSVYNRPEVCPPLDLEDEELLRDDEVVTPVKNQGIRKKERPTDKGVSWLVKTQYISPLSTDSAKMSLSEKQAKEMREAREGRNVSLDNLNNREKQIQAIEESFKAAKLSPVHQTKPSLKAVEILPLLPDPDRYDDQFVIVGLDSDPTADFEPYTKLDRSIRDEHESQAIMKSFVVNGSDPTKSEKFLAYLVPEPDKLTKDTHDESEDTSYSWVREYHWDVRGDDADDPTTYLVNFGDDDARYLPLPTKLVLQKKKAKEGRSGDGIEHFPVPSRVTVRKRSRKETAGTSSNHDKVGITNLNQGRTSSYYESGAQHKIPRMNSFDQFSGGEDMSD